MLKYQTILESKKFKVSKVKNTTTGKSWYSFIYHVRYSFAGANERDQVVDYLGENYKVIQSGREWRFKTLEPAVKKYNWALMRWA